MIQSHRKTHRLVLLALAVLLPLLVVLALLVRQPVPTNSRLPATKGATR
jgi:hypothetical protein